MEDSIFTKIIRGEIPCYKVYEDEKVFAMLDIDPLADGHTLVFPKKQVDLLWDLEDEDYMYLMKISKDLAQKIQAEGDYDAAFELLSNLDAFVRSQALYVSIKNIENFPRLFQEIEQQKQAMQDARASALLQEAQ